MLDILSSLFCSSSNHEYLPILFSFSSRASLIFIRNRTSSAAYSFFPILNGLFNQSVLHEPSFISILQIFFTRAEYATLDFSDKKLNAI